MKLHRVALQNLNSLYGNWEIDLERHFSASPIVLICGETGAGKSTILDAISLALFGQTPRLGRSRGEVTVPGLIMSHGTGRCFAEVEFSSRGAEGRQRWKARWECWRARDRAGGALQSPRRSLWKLDPERLVVASTTKGDWRRPFDSALQSLTVDDFERSMLLPQGRFADFLNASEDDRGKLLERLTNTDRYKRIGAAIAEQWSTRKSELERLVFALGEMELLDPEARARTEAELHESRSHVERVRRSHGGLQRIQTWRAEKASLLGRKERAQAAVEEATAGVAALTAERLRHREFRRVEPGLALLSQLDVARSHVAELKSALAQIEQDEAAAAQAADAVISEHTAAAAIAEAAENKRVETQPEISRAIEARAGVASAAETLTAAKERHGRGRASLAELEEKKLGLTKAIDKAKAELEDAEKRVAASGLPEQVEARAALFSLEGSLQERAGRAAQTYARSVDVCARADEAARRVAVLVEESSELRRAAAEAREAVSAAQDRVVEFAQAHDGEEYEAWDSRQEQLQAEQDARVARAGLLQERLAACVDDAKGAETSRQALEGQVASLSERIGKDNARLTSVDEALVHLQIGADAQALLHARELLSEGEPCPVCGSASHDTSAAPELAPGAIVDRASTQAERDRLVSELAGSKSDLASTRRELERLELRRTAAAEELAATLVAVAELCGLDAVDADGAGAALETAERDALSQHGTLKAQRTQYADAIRRLAAARESALRARQALEVPEAQVAGARTAAAAASALLAEANAHYEESAAELEATRIRALEALARLGVADGADLDPRQISERIADERRIDKELSVALQAREALSRRISEQHVMLGEIDARHQALSEEVALSAAEVAAATSAVDRATRVAARLLGGRDPDVVAAELEKSVVDAARVLAELAERRAGAEAALSTLRGVRTQRAADLQTAIELEQRFSESLIEVLHQLDVPDEKALRALSLSADELRRIETLLGAAEESRVRAVAALSEVCAAAVEHTKKRPEGEGEAGSDAELLAELTRQGEELTALEQRAGALAERLRAAAALSEAYAERAAEVDRKRAELGVWETLQSLAGRKGGDEFRRFAQTLNLGDLIWRANRHLVRLAPRYALEKGMDRHGRATLSFQVRDLHLAGSLRPIATLSGGETFLVSLSLALALAEYSTARLSIETLLLDEGFGTLDSETLGVAIGALEQLHTERDAQVFLISHVAGLKERLPAQIRVERMGGGRSRISLAGLSSGPDAVL